MNIDRVPSATARSNVASETPIRSVPVAASPAVPVAPKVRAPEPAPPSADAARQAARQINEFLRRTSVDVEFSFDEQSHHFVVRVVDSETNQVIRQMPSQEVMDAIANSVDRAAGLLLTQTA